MKQIDNKMKKKIYISNKLIQSALKQDYHFFISQIYSILLNRAPDHNGYFSYYSHHKSGMNYESIVYDIYMSKERLQNNANFEI
jgi:hypothetical protein